MRTFRSIIASSSGRSIIAALVANALGCATTIDEAPSEHEGTDLESQGRSPADCDALLARVQAAAQRGREECRTTGAAGAALTTGNGVAGAITALGGKVPPQLSLALGATVATCNGTLPAIDHGIDALQATCRAQVAAENYFVSSAAMCRRMNGVPIAQRRAALPPWCPDRDATSLYYCGAPRQPVPCISFEGGWQILGYLRQFTATAPVAMTYQGRTNVYRRTSFEGRRCFVPVAGAVCSDG
jgi:hypothetical protein